MSFLDSLFFCGWLFWGDGINKCGWCFALGRGCWIKGLHQIPNVSWLFLTLPHLLDCLICTSNVNQADLFPLPFCKTCVADKNGAARGIAVWPYMIELLKYYQSLSLYDFLMQSHTDHLLFAKMEFFHDIANILNEFLTKFQT